MTSQEWIKRFTPKQRAVLTCRPLREGVAHSLAIAMSLGGGPRPTSTFQALVGQGLLNAVPGFGWILTTTGREASDLLSEGKVAPAVVEAPPPRLGRTELARKIHEQTIKRLDAYRENLLTRSEDRRTEGELGVADRLLAEARAVGVARDHVLASFGLVMAEEGFDGFAVEAPE